MFESSGDATRTITTMLGNLEGAQDLTQDLSKVSHSCERLAYYKKFASKIPLSYYNKK